MAATEYTLATTWGAGARFTAAAQTDILLVNPLSQRDQVLLFTTTMSDTAPALTPGNAAFLRPGDAPRALQLVTGERLWMASLLRAGVAVIEA